MEGDEENPGPIPDNDGIPKEDPKDDTVGFAKKESIGLLQPTTIVNAGNSEMVGEKVFAAVPVKKDHSGKEEEIDSDNDGSDSGNDDSTDEDEYPYGNKNGNPDTQDQDIIVINDNENFNPTIQEQDITAIEFPFFSIVVVIFFGLAIIGGIKALARESATWKGLRYKYYIRMFGNDWRSVGESNRAIPLFAWTYGALLTSIIIFVCAIKENCCARGNSSLCNRESESRCRSRCRDVGAVSLFLLIFIIQTYLFWEWGWQIVLFAVSSAVALCLYATTKRSSSNLPSPTKPKSLREFRLTYWSSVWIFISCSSISIMAISLDQVFYYGNDNLNLLPVYFGIYCVSVVVFMIRIVKWRKSYVFNISNASDEKNHNENNHDNSDAIDKDENNNNDNICNAGDAKDIDHEKNSNEMNNGGNEKSKDHETNFSENNVMYIKDLCILLVLSGLGCPICSLIIKNDTRNIMLIFLGITILPSILWFLVKSSQARNRNRTRRSEFETDTSKPQKFPKDTYSFLAVYSWKHNNNLFCFGLTVFFFQASLLVFMILSALMTRYRTGEIDNPDSEDNFLGFFPTNATALVRATQFVSILAFSLFPQASLSDVTKAIKLFPRGKYRDEKELKGLALSCTLRFIQGILSVFAVFLLVMTSSEVSEVVLNFTAVNFISEMDEIGFELAHSGYYGRALKNATKHIKGKYIPRSSDKRRQCGIGQAYTNTAVALFLLILTACAMYTQEDPNLWTTDMVRVQFTTGSPAEDAKLSVYNGCYELDQMTRIDKRHVYRNGEVATIGYCKGERRWLLYSGSIDSPCDALKEGLEIARSPKSDFFDIESSIEEQWLNAINVPIGLNFIQVKDLEKTCDSFLDDGRGKCDAVFNFPLYEYDKGDCCAHTCTGRECGKAEGLEDGEFEYPDCIPQGDTTRITIYLEFDDGGFDDDYEYYRYYDDYFYDPYSYEDQFDDYFTRRFDDDVRSLNSPLDFECDGKTVFKKISIGRQVSCVVPMGSTCFLRFPDNKNELYGQVQYNVTIPSVSDSATDNSDGDRHSDGGDGFQNIFNSNNKRNTNGRPTGQIIHNGIISIDEDPFTIPFPTNSPTRSPSPTTSQVPTFSPTISPTKTLHPSNPVPTFFPTFYPAKTLHPSNSASTSPMAS